MINEQGVQQKQIFMKFLANDKFLKSMDHWTRLYKFYDPMSTLGNKYFSECYV